MYHKHLVQTEARNGNFHLHIMAESLFRFPGNLPGKITKWKAKKGARVYSGSLLALYETNESKNAQKLKANDVGTVLQLLVETNQEILPG